MALSVAAVWVNPVSKNHVLPRSFCHSPASTPPSRMGISSDSPVRLSVMVTLSAMDANLPERPVNRRGGAPVGPAPRGR